MLRGGPELAFRTTIRDQLEGSLTGVPVKGSLPGWVPSDG